MRTRTNRFTRAAGVAASAAALIGASVALAPSAAAADDPYFCNTYYADTSSDNANHVIETVKIPMSWGFGYNCKLHQGDHGSGVSALQLTLKKCYGQSIAVDGSFGPATFAALKKAQTKMGVASDGVYGYNTRMAMKWAHMAGTTLYKCAR